TRNIEELGGLLRTMPLTAAAFIACALTIIGFPPTAGFYGKLMIIMGTLEGDKSLFALLAILGGVVTLVYMLRLFSAIFLGKERQPDVKEGTRIMLATVIAFAVLSLIIGFLAQPLLDVVQALVAQMIG
ncbi:MAG TPA: proton-conducting transporter membrane subunit, partial [Anaerolineales bacterium]|nr:proton-conducting transporter membrane subunit [Anaerolineales bacterium]